MRFTLPVPDWQHSLKKYAKSFLHGVIDVAAEAPFVRANIEFRPLPPPQFRSMAVRWADLCFLCYIFLFSQVGQ